MEKIIKFPIKLFGLMCAGLQFSLVAAALLLAKRRTNKKRKMKR